MCSVVNFALQFYLREREIKFHIVTYCKYFVKYNLCRKIYTFSNFRVQLYLFPAMVIRNQWNVKKVKNKTYMKMERKYFGRKDEGCSHLRCIQKPVKYLRWKNFFPKYLSTVINYFLQKAPSKMCDRVLNMSLFLIQIEQCKPAFLQCYLSFR